MSTDSRYSYKFCKMLQPNFIINYNPNIKWHINPDKKDIQTY